MLNLLSKNNGIILSSFTELRRVNTNYSKISSNKYLKWVIFPAVNAMNGKVDTGKNHLFICPSIIMDSYAAN